MEKHLRCLNLFLIILILCFNSSAQLKSVAQTLLFEGALALNNKLSSSEKIVEGRLQGPEHIEFHNGVLYTGVAGQGLVRIVRSNVEPIVNFGSQCKLPEEEPTCGRILGIAVDSLIPNSLLIADAYYGIFHYNLDTKANENLVRPDQLLPGYNGSRPSKIFNAIATAKNGDFYWTSTSSNYHFNNALYILLDNPTGRLFRYNRQSHTNQLLVDGLHFANGIVLSPNEDFAIIAETTTSRLLKHHLKGTKAGATEVFIEGLPGGPDNIVADDFGIWVALPLAIDRQNPFISHLLSNIPQARQFIINLLAATESSDGLLKDGFPNSVKKVITSYVGSFAQMGFAIPPRATVLRIDWDGTIRETLYATNGSIGAISHATVFDGYLYLGSPFNDFIARYPL